MQLLPICAEAPLDGEPAIGKVSYGNSSDRDEIISLSLKLEELKNYLQHQEQD